MRIDDYARLLRMYGLLFLIVLLIGAGAGAGFSMLQTPRYQASVKVYVAVEQATNLADLAQGSDLAQTLVRGYSQVVATPLVLDRVVKDVGLRITSGALAKQVTTTSPLDTPVLQIDVTDRSPTRAARIADSIATNLQDVIPTLTPATASSAQPVAVTILQRAVAPTSPVVPNLPLDLAIGVAAALAIALLIVLVRNALRRAAAEYDAAAGREQLRGELRRERKGNGRR